MPANNAEFILYHTDACHLCEIAAELISALPMTFSMQDICDDELLAERYGVVIPVFKNLSSGEELHWPFTTLQLKEFTGA